MKIGSRMLVLLVILLLAGSVGAWEFAPSNFNELTIQEEILDEKAPAVAYNYERDQFLVVYMKKENDWNIFGCFVAPDGSQVSPPFVISRALFDQKYPDVDYNRVDEQYMVVWEDGRNGIRDIYGIVLDGEGKKVWPNNIKAQEDSSFVVSDADTSQHHAKIAHNYIDNCYLVVWTDERVTYAPDIYSADIYAQRVNNDGALLPPYDTPNSEINFPIIKMDYEEYAPDVAYHGGTADFELNEWLVVWVQDEWGADMPASRIYCSRIRGPDGAILGSWGIKYGPRPLEKVAGGPEFRNPPLTHDGDPESEWWNLATDFYCGSPHVISNDVWTDDLMFKSLANGNNYPVPEMMVSWTDFRNSDYMMMNNPDIYCQRLAYYDNEDAYVLGLTQNFAGEAQVLADTNKVMVPVDENGNFADSTKDWITWPNIPVSKRHDYQSWADLNFSQNDGEYLIAWNDGRNLIEGGNSGPMDIYGQRIFINPDDSALVFLSKEGSILPPNDRQTNMPIAMEAVDEGVTYYPGLDHGTKQNQYLVAYNFDGTSARLEEPWADVSTDIHGTMVAGEVKEPEVVTGFTEDFDDGVLAPYWQPEDGGGFVLTEADGQLQIDVAKEAGWAAVRFVPTPDYLFNMSANPYISVKVKASADVVFQLGATNLDQEGNPNSVPPNGPNQGNENVIGGNDWVVLAFEFSTVFATNGTAGDQVHTIFMNFNPGNQWTDPTNTFLWNGTVWLDDFQIGDQADLSTLGVASQAGLPKEFALSQNYPNPFNPTTMITLALPTEDHVTVTVFDIQGRKVLTLIDHKMAAGYHDLMWDSRNDAGMKVTSGVYVYQVKTSRNLTSKKMILMR